MLEALDRRAKDGLKALVEELGLGGETVTDEGLRAAVETAPEPSLAEAGEALFQDGGERGPFGPVLRGYESDYIGAALALEAIGEGEAL